METKIIQSDFDQLAVLDTDVWDHNSYYQNYLLKQIPPRCEKILDIGCGTGSFSRQLSQYAKSVVALDLSPVMIEIARQRSASHTNIEYLVADVLTWDFPKEQFDCVVSIATLHHLPFESIIQQMKSALKDNGIIMVLDLYEPESIRDKLMNLLAVPFHMFLKLKNTGRIREPKEVREAWAKHGEHDTYLPVSEVHRMCQDMLPGASIKKHLLWRYSIVWQKQVVSEDGNTAAQPQL